MKILVQRLRRFCGFLTGIVFFLSGVFKLMDPVGAGLVMSEYFRFFHAGFMDFAALPAGVLLALAEATIGAALVTGVWRRLTAVAVSVFMAFFTLLSAVLVIFNPEMDCGCFGEVIHLTHMQTFLKNIILCALILLAFYPYREFGHTRRRKYVAFPMVMTVVLAFTAYSMVFIPLADYTDFKPASRLMAAERHHEQTQEDMFDYVLIYEKDGKRQEFSLDQLPDSTWTFVDSKAVPKPGYPDEVSPELAFTDSHGEYCDHIATEDGIMVISIYSPDALRRSGWEKVRSFMEDATSAGYTPVLIAASYPQALLESLSRHGLDEDTVSYISLKAYYGDYKTLVTLNRSNGGVTYFDKGYLVRKWARVSMPDAEALKVLSEGDVTETLLDTTTRGNLTFKGFLLYCFAVMLLV